IDKLALTLEDSHIVYQALLHFYAMSKNSFWMRTGYLLSISNEIHLQLIDIGLVSISKQKLCKRF
ncbi:hypothetical protein, partial [Myroides marinus]|uniref:hypothetical protein n=1 Tax=Myroides marinus TaxID=703342 RepID=UPI002577E151